MSTIFNEAARKALKSAYYLTGLDFLTEANVNRIMKHGEDEGFIVISAHRSSITNDLESDVDHITDNYDRDDSLLKQFVCEFPAHEMDLDKLPELLNSNVTKEWLARRNKKADSELESDIKSFGYSYTPVFGGYKEGNEEDSYEPSYIVYNRKKGGEMGSISNLIKFAVKMCGKYKQMSVYIKRPGEAPVYVDKDANIVSKRSSKDDKINRENEMYFTTANRDKKSKERFTSNIEFPDEGEDFTPEKIFEGKLFRKNIEYTDRIRRSQNGEIFL